MKRRVNLSSHGAPAGLPTYADADTRRLMPLVEALRFGDVERAAREILQRNARHPLALKALSFALVGLRRFDEVLPLTEQALQHSPNDGELHNNRAIALAELMRWEEAVASFESALKFVPKDPEIHKNMGLALFRINRWNESVPPLMKAIELHPGDYLEAVEILAKSLYYARRMDEAYAVCRALHEEYPDNPYPLCRLTDVELHRCSWGDLERNVAKIGQIVDLPTWSTSPWVLFKYWNLGLPEYRRMAERFAAAMIPESVRQSPDVLPLSWRRGGRPLHVAYLSSDFGNHPVSNVVAELIERHDRSRVRVSAYALNSDDGTLMRRRLEGAFDSFVAVDRSSVREIANRMRADGVDIAVDLNGWTGGSRAEALALRCAPIQVNWLGYAGTMGWRGLADYLIGDAVVTPLEDQAWYTETLMRMPNSYMPVDTRHPVGAVPTRESQGLPPESFVLCSFNNGYKLNPPLFDLWCGMLRQMPDAVLWLSQGNDTLKANLRREVEQRGVAGERLVFAKHAPDRADYLARIGLADLALDPFPYNSHSTGVDALLSGVPMVAKIGSTFPARVGASLLKAAGLPELIAATDDDYAVKVMALYHDRALLARMRKRLVDARASAPLFDMQGFARDLEDLYFTMADETISSQRSIDPCRAAPASAP